MDFNWAAVTCSLDIYKATTLHWTLLCGSLDQHASIENLESLCRTKAHPYSAIVSGHEWSACIGISIQLIMYPPCYGVELATRPKCKIKGDITGSSPGVHIMQRCIIPTKPLQSRNFTTCPTVASITGIHISSHS